MASREYGVSRFAVRCILELAHSRSLEMLDVPCGFGRHSIWLSEQGHHVTAVDVDAGRVAKVREALTSSGSKGRALVADATKALPFEAAAFDGAIIVDYVERELLRQIGQFVRPGGFLIYETFSARGSNWRELMPEGEAEAITSSEFETINRISGKTGPPHDQRETIKLFARRIGKSATDLE